MIYPGRDTFVRRLSNVKSGLHEPVHRWARTLLQEVYACWVVQGKFVPLVARAQACERIDGRARQIKCAYELLQQSLRYPVQQVAFECRLRLQMLFQATA